MRGASRRARRGLLAPSRGRRPHGRLQRRRSLSDLRSYADLQIRCFDPNPIRSARFISGSETCPTLPTSWPGAAPRCSAPAASRSSWRIPNARAPPSSSGRPCPTPGRPGPHSRSSTAARTYPWCIACAGSGRALECRSSTWPRWSASRRPTRPGSGWRTAPRASACPAPSRHGSTSSSPGIAALLRAARRAFPAGTFDMGHANWMRRTDGTLVLTDPLSWRARVGPVTYIEI